MTREEKIMAFTMHLDGKSWEEIGKLLNYTPQAVRAALASSLEKHPHTPVIIYPAIRQHVLNRYSGSVADFADKLGVSHSRLRRVLFCGERASDRLSGKIAEDMGMNVEEIFKRG